jgi:hypothetical protein
MKQKLGFNERALQAKTACKVVTGSFVCTFYHNQHYTKPEMSGKRHRSSVMGAEGLEPPTPSV